MKAFMDRDFLLSTETAKKLYHETAEKLPIIDYHCHLDPKEIYEDRRFENITEVWLGQDHYKWRLMRSFGVDEYFITGDAPAREKFQKWAETLSYAIGSPLYHWSHLELRNYFGFEGHLTAENAEEVWNLCNDQLAKPEFSARNLILRSNVEVICTTDDPADTLEWHAMLKESGFPVKVLPSFRPDKALAIQDPAYLTYLMRLGSPVNFEALAAKLIERLDVFAALGCRVTDHGMAFVPFREATEEEIEAIYAKRLAGVIPTDEETEAFRTALLLRLGRAYKERNLVMQLHFGVIRDLSKRVFKALGPDAGIDAIADPVSTDKLARFLNALDETGELPKTILYSLSPNDNAAIETVMGAFQTGEARGKIQHGSAWWFNDHKGGMTAQMESFAEKGHFATFVGMLTDSRSFLSYARHEYFRRILSNLVGNWVENGEFPNDPALLQKIVAGVSYENAAEYFGF